MAFRFIFFGLSLTLIVWIFQRQNLKLNIKILMLGILVTGFGLMLYLSMDKIFLGDRSWYDATPFKELILLFFMLIGMCARYITKLIEERREELKELAKKYEHYEKPKLNFDIWEFSYPLFFSVVTFGSLLGQTKGDNLSLTYSILSFQTGFFWQTLLKKEIGSK